MATYVRANGSDTWHWCKNCSNYPAANNIAEVSYTRPTKGELDNECKAKEKTGNCKG